MNPPLFIAKFNYIPTKKARVSKKVCDILRAFLDVISLAAYRQPLVTFIECAYC
jgi:hypothetical protein